jgi:hypothetical protein
MTPDQLLDLAAKAVIRPGLLKNTKIYGRPEQLFLWKSSESGKKGDVDCDVYFIRQAKDGEVGFPAYVCDYERGTLHYQVLSTEAALCFTTTINGCTFSLGTPASDGTLIVSHGNLAGDAMDKTDLGKMNDLDQTGRQKQVAREFHGGGGAFVDPSIYWSGGTTMNGGKINVTVFGVRKDTGWEFYFQRFYVKSSINYYVDLSDFKTQSVTF